MTESKKATDRENIPIRIEHLISRILIRTLLRVVQDLIGTLLPFTYPAISSTGSLRYSNFVSFLN